MGRAEVSPQVTAGPCQQHAHVASQAEWTPRPPTPGTRSPQKGGPSSPPQGHALAGGGHLACKAPSRNRLWLSRARALRAGGSDPAALDGQWMDLGGRRASGITSRGQRAGQLGAARCGVSRRGAGGASRVMDTSVLFGQMETQKLPGEQRDPPKAAQGRPRPPWGPLSEGCPVRLLAQTPAFSSRGENNGWEAHCLSRSWGSGPHNATC